MNEKECNSQKFSQHVKYLLTAGFDIIVHLKKGSTFLLQNLIFW